MILTIETVENGFILRTKDEGEEDSVRVFEDGDSEIRNLASLLAHISDTIGPGGSRYDEERLYIEVKPGDKHPDYRE